MRPPAPPILAWTIGARLDPSATCRVLVEAGQHLVPADARPIITVTADSGVENVNAAVDATLLAERLHRVLAQVEDTLERVRTLVAFFIDEHNIKMPHAAFRGQTPDEVFFGTASNLSVQLDAARAEARELRLAANRSLTCGRCAPAAGSEIPP